MDIDEYFMIFISGWCFGIGIWAIGAIFWWAAWTFHLVALLSLDQAVSTAVVTSLLGGIFLTGFWVIFRS